MGEEQLGGGTTDWDRKKSSAAGRVRQKEVASETASLSL